jgi:hypothetical protein
VPYYKKFIFNLKSVKEEKQKRVKRGKRVKKKKKGGNINCTFVL